MMLSSMASLCGFDLGGAGKRLFAGTGLGTNERMRLIKLLEEVDLGGGERYVERSYGVVDSLGLGAPTMGASTPRAQCHASAICGIDTS